MPISEYYGGHGNKVLRSMKEQYGPEKGKQVFYATANKEGQKPKGDQFNRDGYVGSREAGPVKDIKAKESGMTLAQAKVEAARYGCVLTKSEDGEYRVNLKGGSEATAYYTDDIDDAVGTAKAMQRDAEKFRNARDVQPIAVDGEPNIHALEEPLINYPVKPVEVTDAELRPCSCGGKQVATLNRAGQHILKCEKCGRTSSRLASAAALRAEYGPEHGKDAVQPIAVDADPKPPKPTFAHTSAELQKIYKPIPKEQLRIKDEVEPVDEPDAFIQQVTSFDEGQKVYVNPELVPRGQSNAAKIVEQVPSASGWYWLVRVGGRNVIMDDTQFQADPFPEGTDGDKAADRFVSDFLKGSGSDLEPLGSVAGASGSLPASRGASEGPKTAADAFVGDFLRDVRRGKDARAKDDKYLESYKGFDIYERVTPGGATRYFTPRPDMYVGGLYPTIEEIKQDINTSVKQGRQKKAKDDDHEFQRNPNRREAVCKICGQGQAAHSSATRVNPAPMVKTIPTSKRPGSDVSNYSAPVGPHHPCECEAGNCPHGRGACEEGANARYDVAGYKQWLCPDCARFAEQYAKRHAGGHFKPVSDAREVLPV